MAFTLWTGAVFLGWVVSAFRRLLWSSEFLLGHPVLSGGGKGWMLPGALVPNTPILGQTAPKCSSTEGGPDSLPRPSFTFCWKWG